MQESDLNVGKQNVGHDCPSSSDNVNEVLWVTLLSV